MQFIFRLVPVLILFGVAPFVLKNQIGNFAETHQTTKPPEAGNIDAEESKRLGIEKFNEIFLKKGDSVYAWNNFSSPKLTEFVEFKLRPLYIRPVSEVDQMNGISFNATLYMNAKALRTRERGEHQWSDWRKYGSLPAFSAQMVKRDGNWTVTTKNIYKLSRPTEFDIR